MKYVKQFLRYFEQFPAFTTRDVKLFLRKNGASKGYYRVFMHNLVRSGRAFGIKKGAYTLYDDPMMGGFTFSPFYYGLETALTYHKLWDYVTPVTIVTTRRITGSKIELLGRNTTVRRIQRKLFFGYSMVGYGGGFYIPMADIEKTLIDSVYFHTRFSRDVYLKMAKRIDAAKLNSYLKQYSGIVKKQVNGYLQDYEE